ncbi:MAG: family tricarboxylate transporter, receptor protein [Hyphomicrobiales bacterium]|nr:family tricarboxylate transporter, receptor protein [Hyphomicrobiales bacterium]
MRSGRRHGRVLGALAWLLVSSAGALAQGEPAFFAGKTIRISVGAAAGAAYDFMARVVANHYGRHIPGAPSFLVENLPGAGSLIMLNTFAKRAPADGTAVALPLGGLVHEARLHGLSRDGSNVQFDPRGFAWLGSPAQQPLVFVIWRDAPFERFADLQARPSTFGTTSFGGDNYAMPMLTNQLMGTKIKIVAGYKGVNDIFHAMEQGEVQGSGMVVASLLAKEDWMRERKARVLLHFGADPMRGMPDVPAALDFAPNEATRSMLRLYALKYKVTYPFILPAGVPPERVSMLRTAFDALMKDPPFIAEARRFGIDVDPVSGRMIEEIVAEIDRAPPEVISRLKTYINASEPSGSSK